MKKILFLFLILFAASTAQADVTISGTVSIGEATVKEQLCDSSARFISIYGDSISLDVHDKCQDGYSYRYYLQQLLGVGCYDFVGGANNPPVEVDNFDNDSYAVSGENCSETRTRFEGNMATAFDSYTDKSNSWIIIQCGTNDIADGRTEQQTLDDIEAMIDYAETNEPDINILVMTSGTHNTTSNNNAMASQADAVEAMINTKQATKSNVYVFNMNDWWVSLGQTAGYGTYYWDYVHLNDTGCRKVATYVFPIIRGFCSELTYCNAP